MRIRRDLKTELGQHSVVQTGAEMVVKAEIKLSFKALGSDKNFPDELEALVEQAGQEYKQKLYGQLLEWGDRQEAGAQKLGQEKGEIQKIGYKGYSFKTIFGEIHIKRQRIKYKAENRSEIPSARVWETPRRVMITKGLRRLVCNLVLKESISSAWEQVHNWVGTAELISRSSVLNILHEEGGSLVRAQEGRAKEVFDNMAEAQSLNISSRPAKYPRKESYLSYAFGYYEEEEELKGCRVKWEFEMGGSLKAEEAQKKLEKGLVVVELDEIKIPAQSPLGREWLLMYTGVVNAGEGKYYFSGETANNLFYQVGALLAVLGIHKGQRELRVIGDGAKWIRNWYKELELGRKSLVLCWYHLSTYCYEQIKISFGPDIAFELGASVVNDLWGGKVKEVLAKLELARGKAIRPGVLSKLLRYLKIRSTFIINYQLAQLEGRWIANTRVEKFNDWVLAKRCKVAGEKWTYEGVKAIGALETARRNGELEIWWETRELPKWAAKKGQAEAIGL